MLQWLKNLTYKIEERAAKSKLIYRIASRYYKKVIQKESALANITSDDHVLCIGGGICPFSAILFHQITKAKVTVIDNNCDCIPKAKQVINGLNLSNFVRVLHADGESINLEGYSVIHLALQVSPIEKVFAKIQDESTPGARILMRRPKKHLDKLYCKMSRNSLKYGAYAAHKSRNIGSTLLFTIQEEIFA